MKKIVNPYAKAGRAEYQCFGCSPQNAKGLQMKFQLDGEEVVSVWNPQKWAEGYMNVLHGGIQATLLDEVAAHLDARRRRALVDLIASLGVQAFMTGTDVAPFEAFAGEAEIIAIPDAGRPDFREF